MWNTNVERVPSFSSCRKKRGNLRKVGWKNEGRMFLRCSVKPWAVSSSAAVSASCDHTLSHTCILLSRLFFFPSLKYSALQTLPVHHDFPIFHFLHFSLSLSQPISEMFHSKCLCFCLEKCLVPRRKKNIPQYYCLTRPVSWRPGRIYCISPFPAAVFTKMNKTPKRWWRLF